MKHHTAYTILVLIVVFFFGIMRTAVQASYPPFYETLQPHGSWLQWDDGLYLWQPSRVLRHSGWRPYYHDGYWGWTGTDWQWVSDHAWGEVVFHYGHWWDAPTLGWVWVPGTVYAPAWVEWRYRGDAWGWAPIPPPMHLRPALSFGIRTHIGSAMSIHFDLLPRHYVFVPVTAFSSTRLTSVGYYGSTHSFHFSGTRSVVCGPSPYTVGSYRTVPSRRRPHPAQTVVSQSTTTIVNVNPARPARPPTHRRRSPFVPPAVTRPPVSQRPPARPASPPTHGRRSPFVPPAVTPPAVTRPPVSQRPPARPASPPTHGRRSPFVPPAVTPPAVTRPPVSQRPPARPSSGVDRSRRSPFVPPSQPAVSRQEPAATTDNRSSREDDSRRPHPTNRLRGLRR